MKNRYRSIRVLTCFLLVLVLTFFGPSITLADDLANLQNQYNILQQQQKQLQQQMKTQNSQLKTESQKMATINESVKVTLEQIALMNTQITTLDAQLADKAQDITVKQKNIDDNMVLYKQRLRAMYVSGNESYLDVLLSSDSFTDFLTRAQALKTVSEYDNSLINSLQQDETQLKEDQSSLETAKANIITQKSTLNSKQDMLGSQLAQQGQMVSSLKQNLSSTQQQSNEIDAEINSVIAQEAAARARELAKKPHESLSASVNDVIKYAESLQGRRYVFDTAGPRTFDCSGYTQYVFANTVGIALTHSALQQSHVGTPVSRNNLAPGDLVFFATEGNGVVSHVGIYIGNDQFIAANTSSGVSINGLFSSSYWNRDYVSARRILS
jgi:cell wall-associated NlpC family hydrolase